MKRLMRFVRRGVLAAVLTAGIVMSAGLFSGVSGLNQHDGDPDSLFGNYLAGRQARLERDTGSAASFYSKALEKDPDNKVILEQTFLLETASGDWPRAVSLARSLVNKEESHRVARLVLGVTAFRNDDLAVAEEHFAAARNGPISDLTTGLSIAWLKLAAGKPGAALEALDGMEKVEWAQFYRYYHKGLIADMAGRSALAREAFSAAFEQNKRTRRIAEAYARHAARAGDTGLARQILNSHIESTSSNELSDALLAEIDSGGKPDAVVSNAAEGLAEVFFGIGDALTGEGGIEVGTIYLQLALHLRPEFTLAVQSLGDVYDSSGNYEQAIEAYDRVPESSPLWLNIQIRKAYALNSMERTDEAVALLEELAEARPGETRPLDAMGSILRSHERYEEAAESYDRAIALLDEPDEEHWALFYARGVCYERMKEWPKAEADLQRALELGGDQPLVLNYLGYSWVDQGLHLDKAMKLIRKAVELKPEDGYFVDSLGWAYYRLGDYQKATKHLERAVELRPDDPVINDHLGDAYWRVGRRLEARYQWSQALTLDPEPEDKEEIKLKLSEGLEAVADKKAVAAEQPVPADEKREN